MVTSTRKSVVLFVFWMALIFTTSCFFISSPMLFRFVQGLIHNTAFQRGFARFWVGYGVFVVKGWHATEYAVFVLCCTAVMRSRFLQPFVAIRWALLIAVVFAASDEWHQTFVPGRDGCVRDVIIDSAGALSAALWLIVRERKWRQGRENTCSETSVRATSRSEP